MEIKTQVYKDGIAFLTEDNQEIAFYSNILDRITYSFFKHPDYHVINCACLRLEDNEFIMNSIKEYLKEFV